jgi:hypothetical protein
MTFVTVDTRTAVGDEPQALNVICHPAGPARRPA